MQEKLKYLLGVLVPETLQTISSAQRRFRLPSLPRDKLLDSDRKVRDNSLIKIVFLISPIVVSMSWSQSSGRSPDVYKFGPPFQVHIRIMCLDLSRCTLHVLEECTPSKTNGSWSRFSVKAVLYSGVMKQFVKREEAKM